MSNYDYDEFEYPDHYYEDPCGFITNLSGDVKEVAGWVQIAIQKSGAKVKLELNQSVNRYGQVVNYGMSLWVLGKNYSDLTLFWNEYDSAKAVC